MYSKGTKVWRFETAFESLEYMGKEGGMRPPSRALGSQLSQLWILHLPECESACGTDSAEDDGIKCFAN
jgi:hypothetical protein